MAHDTALHNATELGITDLYAELIADENRVSSMADGFHRGHQDASAIALQRVADRDTVARRHQQHGLAPSEAEMAALETAIERAKFESKSAYTTMTKHGREVSIPTKEALRESSFYLNSQAPYLRVVPSPVIKGNPRTALEDATAGIAERRRQKRDWRNRKPPLESVLNAALDNLEALCVPVACTVGDDGSLAWDSLARGLDIRGHDKIERVFDPMAFFLAVPGMKAKLAAHIEKVVRDKYAGITDTATEMERRVALAKLDEEILELQRVQVAAIRAIRATGEWMPFPANIDVRCLLSVEGPRPRPRN